MNYDILTIALILYYAVMFVFAILYLNDWRCYSLGLSYTKKAKTRRRSRLLSIEVENLSLSEVHKIRGCKNGCWTCYTNNSLFL